MQKKNTCILEIPECPSQVEDKKYFKSIDRAILLSIKCVINNERTSENNPSIIAMVWMLILSEFGNSNQAVTFCIV